MPENSDPLSTGFADATSATFGITINTYKGLLSGIPQTVDTGKLLSYTKFANNIAAPIAASVAFAEAPEGYKATAMTKSFIEAGATTAAGLATTGAVWLGAGALSAAGVVVTGAAATTVAAVLAPVAVLAAGIYLLRDDDIIDTAFQGATDEALGQLVTDVGSALAGHFTKIVDFDDNKIETLDANGQKAHSVVFTDAYRPSVESFVIGGSEIKINHETQTYEILQGGVVQKSGSLSDSAAGDSYLNSLIDGMKSDINTQYQSVEPGFDIDEALGTSQKVGDGNAVIQDYGDDQALLAGGIVIRDDSIQMGNALIKTFEDGSAFINVENPSDGSFKGLSINSDGSKVLYYSQDDGSIQKVTFNGLDDSNLSSQELYIAQQVILEAGVGLREAALNLVNTNPDLLDDLLALNLPQDLQNALEQAVCRWQSRTGAGEIYL